MAGRIRIASHSKGASALAERALPTYSNQVGIDLVGPLPGEVQSYVTFVAAVGAESTVKGAAHELIAFLKGPRAIAVMKTQRMEPR